MIYLGLDNGISGGMAALSDYPQIGIVGMFPMPILKARKGNEIDILAVWQWIEGLETQREQITVVIEEPGGSKSASAAASMAGSFHCLRALCALKKLRWHRVTPQAWQKVMLPGCKAGETKPAALAVARQLWPTEAFLASHRSKKPHDGLIDAALIAEFGRRQRL